MQFAWLVWSYITSSLLHGSHFYLKQDDALIDRLLHENPELMVMGSCVLVMPMKDEDVYIMNVGDSRAVVAQQHSKS
jgi:serine/threonine protein phosphatase PrpC